MSAREHWKRIETIHAVTYFAPESIDAAKDAGLRGFWMGYFGFRAAPLGAVSAEVVEAAFANFEASMVRRAIPDAWKYADPAALVPVRAAAAGLALRRLAREVEPAAMQVNEQLELVIDAGDAIGRPLFAANRALGMFDDPVERLWQNCTTLREHRGDGHVAALTAAGIDGCQAHLLRIADQGVPPAVIFDNRGWDDDQQAAALARLRERGLFDDVGITNDGQKVRAEVEAVTDRLASSPFDAALPAERQADLTDRLHRIAVPIATSGTVPFPNPMGLPQLGVDG